jgi:hypothetical protein
MLFHRFLLRRIKFLEFNIGRAFRRPPLAGELVGVLCHRRPMRRLLR